MSLLNLTNILNEWLFFMRNSDIFSTSTRGVTTTAATGTFSGDSSLIISRTNVKNIRSVVVASTTLTYGQDYTVDTEFDNAGTNSCKITFTSSQTGAYTITYDYGSDKIFPDYPRDDLSISSFPRIATDIISMDSQPLGYGNQTTADVTDVTLTALVYSEDQTVVNSTIQSIKEAVKNNENGFYYFKYVRFSLIGPMIDSGIKQEIVHRNVDFVSSLNVEKL